MTRKINRNKPALPDGTKSLQLAFQQHHPHLDAPTINEATNKLLNNMSNHVGNGYQPAVARPNPDGSLDVIVLSLEEIRGKRPRRKA